MWGTKRYFLSAYDDGSPFERTKASFLFYFILYSLLAASIVFITLVLPGKNPFYTFCGILTLVGIVVSLFLFKKKKVELTGHVVIFSLLMIVILQGIFRDIANHDPAMRYHVYIDTASLISIYFIIISFFRDNKVIFFYGVTFEIILFTHSLVIYFNLYDLPGMFSIVATHFITVFACVIAIAFVSTWLLGYMSAIIQQNKDYAERVVLQNDSLELMVEDRTQDLLTSNEKLREFAHIVSHDLKEPLRTISGFVTLMKRDFDRLGIDDEELSDYLAHVTRGTRQMEELISDILSYSKLNIIERANDTVDISRVVADAQASLAKSIEDSSAKIIVHDLLPVSGDKRLLTQLFQNLISNAIKYHNAGQTPIVEVKCCEKENGVLFSISDNGIGISEKYYETIFQAFKRLHSRIEYEGSGIGLAICKKIIDIHKGGIWVESQENIGTTFFFTLPKAQTDMPQMYPVVHAA